MRIITTLAASLLLISGCCDKSHPSSNASASNTHVDLAGESKNTQSSPQQNKADASTISLFDGKTLKGWKTSDFAGGVEPRVENGQLILPVGERLSGVTWASKPPATINYEISLDAMRIDGNDFFCGLTFPYKDAHASLVIGGWGGAVCGISSINGSYASDNETATAQSFESKKWYHIRLRCTPAKIEAWVDDKQIVDLETEGKTLDVHPSITAAIPLGLSSFQTTAAMKNIEFKKL